MLDMTWAWRTLMRCPPAALLWASLAYRVGVQDGIEQERRRIGADLAQAAAPSVPAIKNVLAKPTHAERQRRRGEPADQMRRNLDQPLRRDR